MQISRTDFYNLVELFLVVEQGRFKEKLNFLKAKEKVKVNFLNIKKLKSEVKKLKLKRRSESLKMKLKVGAKFWRADIAENEIELE